jgi:Na+/H+-dicarboxylate symporter
MSFYGSRYFGDIVHGELGKDLFRYHGFVMIVAVAVLVFVMYIGCVILLTKFSYRHFLNRQRLEF